MKSDEPSTAPHQGPDEPEPLSKKAPSSPLMIVAFSYPVLLVLGTVIVVAAIWLAK